MEQGYNEEDIFLDLHSIHEGEFPQHIKEALHDTEFFILLLSKDSFSRDVEKDYYLDEIMMALDLNLRIIPIVFDSLNVEELPIPQALVDRNLRIKNSIPYYPEYPTAATERLEEFMKPLKYNFWDLVKKPMLILTIYAVVTLLSGIGMWIYDNYFMSEESQIETVVDNLQIGDGILAYSIPGRTYIYDTKTQQISCFKGPDNIIMPVGISGPQITQVGFWTVSVGLVYELSRTRLKPHGNAKSVLAYIAVGVSVVAGIGLGCTIERMLFPKQYADPIRDNLQKKDFWIKVVNKKYSVNSTLFIE